MDDAGIYRVAPNLALVQTVDFFSPIVNDAKTFGRIAAANCLSDIWAMGGKAITALNILAFPPQKIPEYMIEELLIGASEKLKEANVVLMGGHTFEQEELLFGMSVTGTINPENILNNKTARIGDKLILTKSLGTNLYSSAFKEDKLTDEQYTKFVWNMERLNMYAVDILIQYNVSSMTDVTGFGLLGHAFTLAKNSDVTFSFNFDSVPFLPDVHELIKKFYFKTIRKSSELVAPYLSKEESIDEIKLALLTESQTSGGILAAVPAESAEEIVARIKMNGDSAAAIIGDVTKLKNDNTGTKKYLHIG